MGRAPPWWCALAAAAAPTDHVDVFVGTVKTGNTFPGATWPHGLAQGRKRVIQRLFNVSVPRARVSETVPTLRERSER